jgi:hypothetical protein
MSFIFLSWGATSIDWKEEKEREGGKEGGREVAW